MADSFTDNFGFVLPEVTASVDTWGGKLNSNFAGLENLIMRLMPPGIICEWSGSIASIPNRWALCDGNNGTPDLRDRFIIGAGGDLVSGLTGGDNFIALTEDQLPSHNHSGSTATAGSHSHSGSTGTSGNHTHEGSTDLEGNHTHDVSYATQTSTRDSSKSGAWVSQTSVLTGIAGSHDHGSIVIDSVSNHTHSSVSINSAGTHNHSMTTNNTGSSTPHENRPPFYALAFIMKLPES